MSQEITALIIVAVLAGPFIIMSFIMPKYPHLNDDDKKTKSHNGKAND